jgi:acyl-CoA thioesterase-1
MLRCHRVRGILLVALALFASVAIASNARTVLVLGDSISAGYGVPTGAGWVDLLARELEAGGTHRVVNASISGETTEGGKLRLPALLAEHRPVVVIVELGGNDGLRGFPLAVTRANLEAIVVAAGASGARVLLAGMRIPPNYGPRYTEGFHALFAELAKTHDAALVPFLLDGIATLPDAMQADGIHPTAAAQPRILDNLRPALEPLSRP